MKKFLAAIMALAMILSLVTIPVTAEKTAAKPIGAAEIRPDEAELVTWDFETKPWPEGWTQQDRDGDEIKWKWKKKKPNQGGIEGQRVMESPSFMQSQQLPTDNWLISPAFVCGGGDAGFQMIIDGMDGAFGEFLGVYVLTNDGEEIQVFADAEATSTVETHSFDLSAYENQTIKLAFAHHNNSLEDGAGWGLFIDMVTYNIVAGAEPEPPATPEPTPEPPATPEPPTEEPPTETPTEPPATPEPEPVESPAYYFEPEDGDPFTYGWTAQDADGDGYNWRWEPEFCVIEGHGCMVSGSQELVDGMPVQVTPDNWLISPAIIGSGVLSFFIKPTYYGWVGDSVGVYVTTDNGATWSDELGYYICENEVQNIEVPLNAFEGQAIKIAFRHYNAPDVNSGWQIQLDAVTVGEPIRPTEIIVDDITIPEGGMAQAAWTVLPEQVFDKSVTFSTADETIAVVNNEGLVTGVAEGTTQLIVTSVTTPEVFGTATITVTPAPAEVTYLNGYINYKWGRFASFNPEIVEYDEEEMRPTFASAYAGGTVYGFLYEYSSDGDGSNFHVDDTSFYKMDPVTHEVEYTGYQSPVQIVSMAYNHATGEMYALGENKLYTVNLALGTLEFVADIVAANGNEFLQSLAIDTEGNAYGLTYSDGSNGGSKLCSIDLETGIGTVIGNTGIRYEYIQSIVWDHNTNRLFWAQFSGAENDDGLYIVDPETAEATFCGRIAGGTEVTALWIEDDLPIAEITIPDFNVTFKDGFTGEEIPGGFVVGGGSVLDPADFPEPPVHEGYVFLSWDYYGSPIFEDTVITAKYMDENMLGFYFETDPALEGWTWIDDDGDGYNWVWLHGNEAEGMNIPEGEGCMVSESYAHDGAGALTPDNWLLSPIVPGGGSVTFKLTAQDPEFCNEPIGVYVSTDGGESWIGEYGYFVATPEIETYTVGLEDFVDQDVCIAFRHYDVTDKFIVILDAVEIMVSDDDEPAPPTEEPPTEEPPTEEPPTAEPPTEEPPTEEPPTAEPEPQEGDVIFDIRNPETEDGLYYAQPGETVTVEFTVTGEYAAHGANINFNFDPEMLTIESLEEGPAMAEIRQVALPVLDYETIPGSIKLGIMAPTDPFSAQGVLYTVCFKVAETAELDAVLPLEIEIEDFFNMPVGEESTPIPTFVYNSSVVVGEAPVPPTEPPTEEPPTEEPPTEEPPTAEPPTEEPPTEEPPTETPTEPPAPPVTGFVSLAGAGIAAILAGTGVVLFRRKRR